MYKRQIEISRVSFRYAPEAPLVLDDVSLKIEPGQFAAIVGASGSGKSTLQRLLLGFETAASGDILYDGQPLDVGASIGIAHFPQHGTDVQTLLRNADIAMYVAKRNKTGFAVYDAAYDSSQQEHLSLLGELRRAVEQKELRLLYQPKVSLHSSNISAVEALIRWNHPVRGVVSPAVFVPFAEQTGYILSLIHI